MGSHTLLIPYLLESFYDDEPEFQEDDVDGLMDETNPDDEQADGDEAIVHSSGAGGPVDSIPTGGSRNAERSTTPYMTKYEKARILGTRALQIRYVPSAAR